MAAPRLNPTPLVPGQTARTTFTFTDPSNNNAPWTPGSVTVTVEDPTGGKTTPAPNQQSSNVFFVVYTYQLPGNYVIRVVGSAAGGVGPSAQEWTVYCDATAIF